MRRVVVLALLTGLLGAAPLSASAKEAAAPTVDVWRGGLPTGFSFHTSTCGPPSAGSAPYYFYSADDRAQQGTGAMVVHTTDGADAQLSRAVTSLSSVTTFRPTMTTRFDDPVLVTVAVPSRGVTGTGRMPGAYLTEWSSLDLVHDLALDWTDDSGFLGSSTPADFAAAHPTVASSAASIALTVGPCEPHLATGFSIDSLEITESGTSTIVDFEGPMWPQTIPSDGAVSYGQSATVRGSLYDSNGPVANGRLHLWGRAAGSRTARLVTTVTTAADGTAAARVTPKRTTFYTWRYGSSHDHSPAVSDSAVEVHVNAYVSIHLLRQAVHAGDPVVAVLRVAPARRQRVAVRVLRSDGRFGRALGTGVVRADGRLRLRFAAPVRRPWRVVATVSSQPGMPGYHTTPVNLRRGGRTSAGPGPLS